MVQSHGDAVYLAKQNGHFHGALTLANQPSASSSSESPLTTPLTQPQPIPDPRKAGTSNDTSNQTSGRIDKPNGGVSGNAPNSAQPHNSFYFIPNHSVFKSVWVLLYSLGHSEHDKHGRRPCFSYFAFPSHTSIQTRKTRPNWRFFFRVWHNFSHSEHQQQAGFFCVSSPLTQIQKMRPKLAAFLVLVPLPF